MLRYTCSTAQVLTYGTVCTCACTGRILSYHICICIGTLDVYSYVRVHIMYIMY